MSSTGNHPANLKRADRVPGVSESACSETFKRAYRSLVKRWHPDRFGEDSKEQVEAMRMTRLINEAYSAVRQAPLCVNRKRWNVPRMSLGRDRLDFPVTIGSMIIGMIAAVLFCALASGLAGDKFWRSIRPWFWWSEFLDSFQLLQGFFDGGCGDRRHKAVALRVGMQSVVREPVF